MVLGSVVQGIDVRVDRIVLAVPVPIFVPANPAVELFLGSLQLQGQ